MAFVITLRGDTDRDYLVEHSEQASAADLRRALEGAAGVDVACLYSGADAIPDSAPLGRGRLRHGSVVGAAPDSFHPPPHRGLVVAITSGPAAGRCATVSGPVRIGRSPRSDLRVADPTMARDHAVLRPLGDWQAMAAAGHPVAALTPVAALHPLGAGATPPGEEASGGARALALGDTVRLGDTVLQLHAAEPTGQEVSERNAPLEPDPADTSAGSDLAEDDRTTEARAAPLPVASLVSALVMGLGWAVVLGARGALLAGLSAASLVAALGANRVVRAVRGRRYRRRHAQQQARQRSLDRTLAEATVARMRADHPDAWAVAASARLGDRQVARSGPTLSVRIGAYQEPATWLGPSEAAPDNVPAVVDLAACGELRISGPLTRRSALAGWVVAQVAAAAGDRVSLTASDEAVRTLGARWLGLIAPSRPSSLDRLTTSPDLPRVCVEVDAPPAGSGSIVIRLAPAPASAPGPALVSCGRGARAVGSVSSSAGEQPRSVVLDLPDREHLEQCARLLCPDRLEQSHACWADVAEAVLGSAPLSPQEVSAAWDRAGEDCRAVVGETERGDPWVLDLAQSGPHLLIGGTTGSGKSQFLRTLILSLCATHSPRSVQFALLDFKGGSAFADLASLPHVRQLATDLDADWADRALASLAREVQAREQILAAAGVPSYEALRKQSQNVTAARLVVVIDEYATVRDSHPELLDGFVDLARRGRSLGLHLILATQRPSGSVSREIAANVGARLAFRTATGEDSTEVVGTPRAASIAAQAPGSALFRVGSSPPAPVRTIPIGRTSDHVSVRPWSWERADASPSGTTRESQDFTADERALVAAIRQAAARQGMAPAPALWPPALPEQVTLTELTEHSEGASPTAVASRADADADTDEDASGVPVGLRQSPARAEPSLFRLPTAAGLHTALFGAARSGRTNALRVTALAAAAADGDQVRVYVLDMHGDVSDLETLAACDAYVGPGELERAHAMLDLLGRSNGATPNAQSTASTLLLVDGWDVLAHQHAATPLPELLTAALRTGRRNNLAAFLTTGQLPLDSRLSALVDHRLVLPLNDTLASAALGVPAARAPRSRRPGRALVAGSEDQLQFAVPGQWTQAHATRLQGSDGAHPGNTDPVRWRGGHPELDDDVDTCDRIAMAVARVPPSIALSDLRPGQDGEPGRPSTVLLGATGGGRPVQLDLAPGTPPLLVTGSSGTGRTETLALIERQLVGSGLSVHLMAARGPAGAHQDWPWLLDRGDRPEEGWIVLIDDLERLDDARGAAVADLLSGRVEGGTVVVTADIDAVSRAFRSPLTLARQCKRRLVLGPRSARDLDAWGIRTPVYGPWPAGRGALGSEQGTCVVQVAHGDRRPGN